jgi:hypothetical protein
MRRANGDKVRGVIVLMEEAGSRQPKPAPVS